MRRFAKSFAFCIVTVLLACPAHAQQNDLSFLVAPLAKKTPHSHDKTVVLPLLSASSDSRLGILLARQISESLAAAVKGLQIIDASRASLPLQSAGNPPHPFYDQIALNSYAKDAGADLIITGNFAAFEGGLGVSLALFKRGHKELLATSAGRSELTAEMKQLLPPSGPPGASPDGVYLAGWGGVDIPRCLKCPDPYFPPGESNHALVVLSVVVGPDGLLVPDGIKVEKSAKASYADAAIAAVKGWKLEPAKGPNGKPVAVRLPIEITFR